MVVFAFAITPKRFLHNLLVNHQDTYNNLTAGKTEIGKDGFYCQCDNLVATSPFTGSNQKPEFVFLAYFIIYTQKAISPVYSATHLSLTLRGPPAFSIL